MSKKFYNKSIVSCYVIASTGTLEIVIKNKHCYHWIMTHINNNCINQHETNKKHKIGTISRETAMVELWPREALSVDWPLTFSERSAIRIVDLESITYVIAGIFKGLSGNS